MTDGMDVDADALRERLSGPDQMVHRLRDWTDGDTLYGCMTLKPDLLASTGKTFREGSEWSGDAETRARDQYERAGPPMSGVKVLYRATVRDVRTDPRDPNDPGEPPLKFATLTEVEVLDWKHISDGGESGE